jgi:hypothetical protein
MGVFIDKEGMDVAGLNEKGQVDGIDGISI